MGLASKQDIPGAPKLESQGWSAKTLWSLGGLAKSFSKTFESPFEWMLAFCLLVIASAELTSTNLSWFFYTVAIILLLCVIVRRAMAGMNEPIIKEKKK